MPTHSIFCSSNVVSVSRPIKLCTKSLFTQRQNDAILRRQQSLLVRRALQRIIAATTVYIIFQHGTQCCDLDHGLETRMHSSSFCPGLGLQTWWPRSRSWSQDSMLGAYARSTITVICNTFTRVLCHQLELMQPVMWSRDHGLETGFECTRDHFIQVSVSVSRQQHWWYPKINWGLHIWWTLVTLDFGRSTSCSPGHVRRYVEV